MIEPVFSYLRDAWNGLQGFLFFLPPFPERIDTLALLSLVLVAGLLVAEWLRSHWQWPRVLGYVVAGTVFGPPLLGWINADILTQIRPFADAAHGLLLLEAGRRLDLRWLAHNRDLLRGTVSDIVVSFLAIFLFALLLVGLKLIPVISEYMGVKRSMAAVVAGANPQTATVSELRSAFTKRALVDDVTTVTASDLDITKEDGRIVMSIEYSRKVKLFGNVSLLIDFSASTADGQ